MRRIACVLTAAALLAGCRGEPARAQGPISLEQLVDSLRPTVERAVGAPFKATPRSALRSREQVRAYLTAKLDQELPPARARQEETAYRLFGLLPDSVELRPLLLDVLGEQVMGFYDPDSLTFFGVAGADPSQLRLVLAHEMVHALQGQYLPLDSILRSRADADRTTAAQAILEGQATLASMRALTPGQDIVADERVWQMLREQTEAAQVSMPELARAPLVVREGLIFPYVGGAEFMRWWTLNRPGELPFGAKMPVSTEQVMHPERYARGDAPVALRIADSSSAVYSEDALGELGIDVLQARLAGAKVVGRDAPLGWGGDRFRVYDATEGPALVWYTVWDDAAAAERFRAGTGARLAARKKPGYRAELEAVTIGGRAGVRYVLAPVRWGGWGTVPAAELREMR